MKLKEIKLLLDNLTENDLENDLLYKSDEYGLSGVVNHIEIATEDLYYTGEDDPSLLYTISQLRKNGYTEPYIKTFAIEIPKGSFYINI